MSAHACQPGVASCVVLELAQLTVLQAVQVGWVGAMDAASRAEGGASGHVVWALVVLGPLASALVTAQAKALEMVVAMALRVEASGQSEAWWGHRRHLYLLLHFHLHHHHHRRRRLLCRWLAREAEALQLVVLPPSPRSP